MAERVRQVIGGVDVSLEWLEVAWSEAQRERVRNESQAIAGWLKQIDPESWLAVEATSRYHEELVEQALAAGVRVYLIDGKQLHHYREAVGVRAKTDPSDAQLLRRYLSREHEQLRPVQALGQRQKQVWRLLKRRASLVKVRTQIEQVLADVEMAQAQTAVDAISEAIRVCEKQMRDLVREIGWQRELEVCRSIPGIGLLNAIALTTAYHRGSFRSADAFIAYLGLDVRVRDSGRFRGKRKLTKRGEPELRRLLHNAAVSFARDRRYRPLYERQLAAGRSTTAAYVVLARRLARTAFALLRKNALFDASRFGVACAAT